MSEEERLRIAKERIEYILKTYNVHLDCELDQVLIVCNDADKSIGVVNYV